MVRRGQRARNLSEESPEVREDYPTASDGHPARGQGVVRGYREVPFEGGEEPAMPVRVPRRLCRKTTDREGEVSGWTRVPAGAASRVRAPGGAEPPQAAEPQSPDAVPWDGESGSPLRRAWQGWEPKPGGEIRGPAEVAEQCRAEPRPRRRCCAAPFPQPGGAAR